MKLVRRGHNLDTAGRDGITEPLAENVMVCGIWSDLERRQQENA